MKTDFEGLKSSKDSTIQASFEYSCEHDSTRQKRKRKGGSQRRITDYCRKSEQAMENPTSDILEVVQLDRSIDEAGRSHSTRH